MREVGGGREARREAAKPKRLEDFVKETGRELGSKSLEEFVGRSERGERRIEYAGGLVAKPGGAGRGGNEAGVGGELTLKRIQAEGVVGVEGLGVAPEGAAAQRVLRLSLAKVAVVLEAAGDADAADVLSGLSREHGDAGVRLAASVVLGAVREDDSARLVAKALRMMLDREGPLGAPVPAKQELLERLSKTKPLGGGLVKEGGACVVSEKELERTLGGLGYRLGKNDRKSLFNRFSLPASAPEVVRRLLGDVDVEFDDFSTVRLVEGGEAVRVRAEEKFGSVRALAGKVGLGERHLYWFLDGKKGVRVYVWRRILEVLGEDLERMVKLERTKRMEGSVVIVRGREELCRAMAEKGVSLRRLAEEIGIDYNALFRALHMVGALTHEVACELAGVPVEGVSSEKVKLALKLALEALRGERPPSEGEWRVADAVVRMRGGVAEEVVAPWGSVKVDIDPKANYRLLDAEAVREVAGRVSEVWGLTSRVADEAGLRPLYEFLMGHQRGLRGEVILRAAALSGSAELAGRVTKVELAPPGSGEDNLRGDTALKPAASASAVNLESGGILEARSVEDTPRRAIPLHTLMARIAQLFLRVRGVSDEEVETRTELGGRRLDALTFTASLGDVEEGGLAKEALDFVRFFLPREERVVLEERGLLAFALEVKTFSDRLDPGEVGKMVERVKGLIRKFGRCTPIPVMLNAGAFTEDLRKLFGREPGATLTSGDVTVTLKGKPKNGYYVVWAETKGMKAAIIIVDCWRAPRGDTASTLALIISAMAETPKTWEQRKRASDVLIALAE